MVGGADVNFTTGFIRWHVVWYVWALLVAATPVAFWRYEALAVHLLYLSIVLHELAHAVAARVAAGAVSTVTVRVSGGRTVSTGATSPLTRSFVVWTSIAGPSAGILVGVVTALCAPSWWLTAVGGGLCVLHGQNANGAVGTEDKVATAVSMTSSRSIEFYGTTPTSSGDLTLEAWTVELIPAV